VTVEVRYWTETRVDSEGNEYDVEVPYNYYICNATLENFDLKGRGILLQNARVSPGAKERKWDPYRHQKNDHAVLKVGQFFLCGCTPVGG